MFGSFDAKNVLSLVKTMSVLGQQRHLYNVSFNDSGKSGWNGELSDDLKPDCLSTRWAGQRWIGTPNAMPW